MDYTGIFENAQQAINFLSGGADLAQKLRKLIKTSKNGMIDASDASELILELHGKIIDAQVAQSTILNDLLNLKQEMMEMDRRIILETRYELTDTAGGAQVLMLREQYHGDETLHYICPACADAAKKSILQPQGTGKCCNPCGTFFPFVPPNNKVYTASRKRWAR